MPCMPVSLGGEYGMHPSGMPLKYKHSFAVSIGLSSGVLIASQTDIAVNNVVVADQADLILDLVLCCFLPLDPPRMSACCSGVNARLLGCLSLCRF